MKLRREDIAPGQSSVAEAPLPESVSPGDYFHSEHDLFWVADCVDGRALIEDCRTGMLIELEVDRVLKMERVEPRHRTIDQG